MARTQAGQAYQLRNELSNISNNAISGGLSNWRKKFGNDAANAVIVCSGDSTSVETLALNYYEYLRLTATRRGFPLFGMQGSNIISRGLNGITLSAWLSNPTNLSDLVAANPDLVVASFLINDVRLGNLTFAQGVRLLDDYINAVKSALPDVSILLRMPNTFLTANVSNLNFVRDSAGNINPAGEAQRQSSLLASIYRSFVNKYDNVEVLDIQALVTGEQCVSDNGGIMQDQLHPQTNGIIGGITPVLTGYTLIAIEVAKAVGNKSNLLSQALLNNYEKVLECLVYNGGNGFIDIGSYSGVDIAGSAFPFNASTDFIFIEGLDAPINPVPTRPFGGNIRFLTSGNWSTFVGRFAYLVSPTKAIQTNNRQLINVDLPSIAAGATITQNVTVPGLFTGNDNRANSVIVTPPNSFASGGLLLINSYPSANDTVTLIIQNPTGAAIDLASAQWAFNIVLG